MRGIRGNREDAVDLHVWSVCFLVGTATCFAMAGNISWWQPRIKHKKYWILTPSSYALTLSYHNMHQNVFCLILGYSVDWSEIKVFQLDLKIECSNRRRKIFLTEFRTISVRVGWSRWYRQWSSSLNVQLVGRSVRNLIKDSNRRWQNFSDRTPTDFNWRRIKPPESLVVFTPSLI